MQNPDPRHAATPRMTDDSAALRTERPFREYISAMASQLADLARSKCQGDEPLAVALEQAAIRATGSRDDGLTGRPIHPATSARGRQG